jgi:dTDP-4-dehydrorhamnose reductase
LTKILIIGASGMLGSTLLRFFVDKSSCEVFGTARTSSSVQSLPDKYLSHLIFGVDIESNNSLLSLLSEVKPDVVINCAGVVKQLPSASNPLVTLPINSIFPHLLSKMCLLSGARLIHFSTDCVFSGSKGMYIESDIPDARDLYGLSKHLGEISDSNSITIRTSIIGHELNTNKSLIEWFLSQNDQVKGYTKAVFSGLPTIEIANIIEDYILPNTNLNGIYHVSSDPISKYELLNTVANIYNKKIEIIADQTLSVDRSLDSTLFRNATGFKPKPWSELLVSMRDFG